MLIQNIPLLNESKAMLGIVGKLPSDCLGYRVDLSLIESGSRTITQYFQTSYSNTITIDWGDGTREEYVNQYGENSPTHTYDEGQDIFKIRVFGESLPKLFGLSTPEDTRQAITAVDSTNYTSVGSEADAIFRYFSNLEYADCTLWQNNTFPQYSTAVRQPFADTKIDYVPVEVFDFLSSTNNNFNSTFFNTNITTPPPCRLSRNTQVKLMQIPL